MGHEIHKWAGLVHGGDCNNSAVHRSTRASSFSLTYLERRAHFPGLPRTPKQRDRSDFLEDVARRLAPATPNLLKARAQAKATAGRTRYCQAGDVVFASSRVTRSCGRGNRKLGAALDRAVQKKAVMILLALLQRDTSPPQCRPDVFTQT